MLLPDAGCDAHLRAPMTEVTGALSTEELIVVENFFQELKARVKR